MCDKIRVPVIENLKNKKMEQKIFLHESLCKRWFRDGIHSSLKRQRLHHLPNMTVMTHIAAARLSRAINHVTHRIFNRPTKSDIL